MNVKPEKTVVITGGTKGIGAAISRAFYEDGAHVLIGARQDNKLADELGERARFVSIDVRQADDHVRLVKAAIEWTGSIDIFINNAGFSEWRALEDVDEEFWNRMIDTNLKGTFFGCQGAAKHMEPGGCIINISSLAGKRGSANNSVYCASKFGVNGITQALAKELGAKGIRVNAVCPVYVPTEGLLSVLGRPSAPAFGVEIDQYLQSFAANNSALGVMPTEAEIAQVCVFLASSSASAITGQCVNVDCGVLPQ